MSATQPHEGTRTLPLISVSRRSVAAYDLHSWVASFVPRWLTSLVFRLLACLVAAPNVLTWAMSPNDFVRFLNHPPAHARAVVVVRNPVFVEPHNGDSIVSVTHEYLWNGRDVLIFEKGDGFVVHTGVYKGIAWSHFHDRLTRYAAMPPFDVAPGLSAALGYFARFLTLGIGDGMIPGSARSEGGVLQAECDMPEARKVLGANPLLLGRFDLLPNGWVGRLEYAFLGGGTPSLIKSAIDFKYPSRSKSVFPSHIVRYDALNDPNEPTSGEWRLLYELEILEANFALLPKDASLNPHRLFPSAIHVLVSNDTRVVLANPSPVEWATHTDGAGRSFGFFLLLAASLALPAALVVWHGLKNRRIQRTTGLTST